MYTLLSSYHHITSFYNMHNAMYTIKYAFPSSSTWKNVPAARRKELLEGDDMGREDGEFYMSFPDFKKHFTDFEVCNVSIDQLYEDEKGKKKKNLLCFICQ